MAGIFLQFSQIDIFQIIGIFLQFGPIHIKKKKKKQKKTLFQILYSSYNLVQ